MVLGNTQIICFFCTWEFILKVLDLETAEIFKWGKAIEKRKSEIATLKMGRGCSQNILMAFLNVEDEKFYKGVQAVKEISTLNVGKISTLKMDREICHSILMATLNLEAPGDL